MVLLGLIKLVVEFRSENVPITFTEKGQEVLSFGNGYKKYLFRERLKKSANWVLLLVAAIGSLIAAVIAICDHMR